MCFLLANIRTSASKKMKRVRTYCSIRERSEFSARRLMDDFFQNIFVQIRNPREPSKKIKDVSSATLTAYT